jgi:hypothetical protein
MKIDRVVLIALLASLAAVSHPAAAQRDISGTWRGQLAVAPDTNLTIEFVLMRGADGSYTAIVTSPDQGGVKDVPASSVSFESNRLVLAVDALSGSYEGTLADGTIAGEWRQEGAVIPLALRPYQRTGLSQADKDMLAGSWVGKLTAPNGRSLAIVLRFAAEDGGDLTGFLDSPDQGAKDIAVTDIELVDGELSLNVPQVRGQYRGTVEGEEITGSWVQGAPTPLTLQKGEYTPTAADIGLTGDDMARLAGSWKGQLGPLEITIRFETNDAGDHVASLNVPAQGIGGLPVSAATLSGAELSLSIAAIGAQFTATLAGEELTGGWTQGPQTTALTLTKQ